MKLISIVIPAFNIEKYIGTCLYKIIDQVDNNDIEIIVVNDGSTDSSGDIADAYAQQYDYIKVIHQPNQGVSAARNRGLLIAKGDYIWFVDGDDFIDNNAISLLTKTIKKNQLDIIFFNHEKFFNKVKKLQMLDSCSKYISVEDKFITHLPSLIRKGVLTYSPCDKIIKRKILLDNDINFNIYLTYSEDYYWNYQIFKVVDTFAYTDQVLYFYRKSRDQSATTQLSLSHMHSALLALKTSVDDIVLNCNDNKTLKSLLLYSSQIFFYILPEFCKARELNNENMRQFYEIYQTYRDNAVELNSYNRGSRVFEIIYKQLTWYHTIHFYSQIVSFRRRVQLSILKRGI